MRWREPLQIIKGRSSTDCLENGTKQFSAVTRPQPPAFGEQVRQIRDSAFYFFTKVFFFHANILIALLSPYSGVSCNVFLFICNADAVPVDHEQYYGFTKFAIELNELDPSLKLLLPPTDTRLRLDQRCKIKHHKEYIFTSIIKFISLASATAFQCTSVARLHQRC